MKMNFLSYLLLVAVFGGAQARADDLTPYLEGREHLITEREYSDLRSYVERAQEVLVQTLEDSMVSSGTELRERLVNGIRSAQQSTGLRHELMLFRYILTRALESDRLYVYKYENAQSAQLSAQIILLPAIESALNYYQSSDLPRLATTTVPSPDWLSFAADQVPNLLRAVDLAPNRAKKAALVKRALGWTAKALNSAVDRRTGDVAKHIVRLGELYNERNYKRADFISRAQDALLAVYKGYRTPLPTVTLAPASAGKDLKMRRDSFSLFDLVPNLNLKRHINRPLFGKDGKSTIIGKSDPGSSTEFTKVFRLGMFFGLGVSGSYDGNSDGNVDARKAATVAIDAIAFATDDSDDFTDRVAPFSAQVLSSADLSPAGKVNDWNYNVSIEGSAQGAFVFAVFGAIERNVFNQFEETILRGGWAPQFVMRLGELEYFVMRGSLGLLESRLCGSAVPNSESCASGKRSKAGVVGLSVILKLKRFSAEIKSNYATYDSSVVVDTNATGIEVSRFGLDGSVNLPLRLLVKNDSLQLKGQVVNYSPGGPSNSTAFIFYGLKW